MSKVHVVGAGPAGSIAAISALRNGHSVVVSEEHQVAGLPENCSGLFSKDGLESLSSFVDYKKHVINPIHGAHLHFIDECMSVRRSDPVGFVCDRSSLDHALAENAESEGARINYGEKVGSEFHSSNIIGADGPFSAVARHFSFPRIKSFAFTLQAMADYRSEDPHMVEVFLSNTRFRGFFGWIIPRDEYTAELGVGVESPNSSARAWKSLLALRGISGTVKPKGAVIPLVTRSRTAMKKSRKNILLAGDAAGQVKATTGGGVIFGGNCAVLAGRYVNNPMRYEYEWRLRHGSDLAIHRAMHRMVSMMDDGAVSALGRRLKKLNCDVYLSHHGHMDRPTKMIRPQIISHMLKNIVGVA